MPMSSRAQPTHAARRTRAVTRALALLCGLLGASAREGYAYSFCPRECLAQRSYGTCEIDETCRCRADRDGVDCGAARDAVETFERVVEVDGRTVRETWYAAMAPVMATGVGAAPREVTCATARAAGTREVVATGGRDALCVDHYARLGDASARAWNANEPTRWPARPQANGTIVLDVDDPVPNGWKGSCGHPRGDAATSDGWSTIAMRGPIVVASATSDVIYAIANAWVRRAGQPVEYGYVVWSDLASGGGTIRNRHEKTTDGYIVDVAAMGTDDDLILKVTPTAVSALGRVLVYSSGIDAAPSAKDISLPTLRAACEACHNRRDAGKFTEAVTVGTTGGGVDMFLAGRAKASSAQDYPAIVRLNPYSSESVIAADGELYFKDATAIDAACEGHSLLSSSYLGRYTAFTALGVMGDYAYVATSSAPYNGAMCGATCVSRISCVYRVRKSFNNTSSAIEHVKLGTSGSLVRDALAIETVSDGGASGGTLYVLTSQDASDVNAPTRIVKVKVFPDVDCVGSACMEVQGSTASTRPIGAMTTIPSMGALFTGTYNVSDAEISYQSFSVTEIDDISPSRGPKAGGTTLTIRGVGFPYDSSWAPDDTLSHRVACRFLNDGSPVYVPAKLVSSTTIECDAPSYSAFAATGTYISAVSISFEGYPDDRSALATFFENSIWVGGMANYMYYDPPNLVATSVTNSHVPSVLFTGEVPNGDPAVIAIDGGPFVDGVLKCRFGAQSVLDAAYVNSTRVTCPLCPSTSANGCGDYHVKMPWLLDPPPTSVTVDFSMNGVDYHTGVALALHRTPNGLRVTHARQNIAHTAYESTKDAGASTMTLDAMTVNLVDNRGTVIADDLGVGGTRGFKITATLNTSLSTDTPGVTMTTVPSTITTLDGKATFQLRFSAPLRMGNYVVDVIGEDCTGSSCIALAMATTFHFTVVPGAPVGLAAIPSSTNTLVVPTNEESDVGVVNVYVLDAAGNRLHNFDEVSHSISVTSVDASNAPRTSGSIINGSTTVSTHRGVAVFRDLKLLNPAPIGARTPGKTIFVNNLTYPAASRGVNDADATYRFLFSASFGSAISAFTTVVGRPRYLEIDNHIVPSMTTSSTTLTIPNAITVRLYDAGNNLITSPPESGASVDVRAYGDSFTLEPTSTTSVTDSTGTATWTFAANSITLDVQPAGYYVIAFYATGSDYIRPAKQLVQLVEGNIGHQWKHTLEFGSDIRYAGSSTPLGDLTIYAADIGGSFLGANDRYDASTLSYTVDRAFACTSSTLSISGTLTGNTLSTGAAVLTGLTLSSATLGVHGITCSSTTNTLKDSSGNVMSTNTSPLVDLNFNITVTSGVPSSFALTNSPVTTYEPEFGVMNMSTFRRYAAAYYVPLDAFDFQMYDAHANGVNYVLGDTPVVAYLEFTSGVSSDAIGVKSDYLTYNATVATRHAFVIPDPLAVSTGLSPSFDVATNAVTFAGLALERAKVGTHTLKFHVPAMPAFSNLTQSITVTLGRAHHLAIRAPCDDYYVQYRDTGTGLCTTTTTLLRSGSSCTCTQYRSAALVVLSPIVIVVMDGGDNLVGSAYSPTCVTGDASCAGTIEAVFDVARTNPCVLSGSACAATQPQTHTKAISSGTATFSDIAFRLPKSTIHGGKAIVTFKSPGLVDVDVSYDVWPGSAASLDVVFPDSFEGLVGQVGLKSSTYTLIGRASEPFVLNVVDAAGNKLLAEDGVNRTLTISVVDSTAQLLGTTSSTTVAGTVVLSNFYLSSPPQGTHVIRFSTSGLSSYDMTVKIIEGVPAKLEHVSTIETVTSYKSSALILFDEFTVHMQDAGGTLLESNQFTKVITATLRSSFNSTRTFTTQAYATKSVTAPTGRSIVKFTGITAQALEVGQYVLTFAGDGLISDSVAVAITLGDASQLNVPSSRGYPTPNDATYSRPTTLMAARVLILAPFAVTVTDGGANEVTSADFGILRHVSVGIKYVTSTTQDPFSQPPEISQYATSSGVGLISGIRLYNPVAGTYRVTVSTPSPVVLTPYSFDILIKAGDISSLDACGCPNCARADVTVEFPVGLCTDTRPYKSADVVDLTDIFVVTRDAGGLLMGSSLDTAEARRAVNVNLKQYTLSATGVTTSTTTVTSPLIADETSVSCADATIGCSPSNSRSVSVGALYIVNGVAAWCADGTESNRAKSFCSPDSSEASENKLAAETAYLRSLGGLSPPNVAGTTGTGLDFYGVRSDPGFVGTATGLKFIRPLAGRYVLEFQSECQANECTSTQNLVLIGDALEVIIEPGDPYRLEFGTQRIPSSYDSNVSLPTFEITVYDISGNVVTNSVDNVTVTVTPAPYAVIGGSERVSNGLATFKDLTVIGRRGTTYSLMFKLGTAELNVTGGLTLFPCSTVKPHSQSTSNGSCECYPGYTEDASGSGYQPPSVSVSSYPGLYAQVDPSRISSFITSLRPYGACVPCAAGFYKTGSGPAPCDACPIRMNTYTGEDGKPRQMHVTSSGETLPGHLANVNKTSCQCTLTGPAQNGTTTYTRYYRLEPYDAYECGSCPDGAVCDSRDITKLSLSEGNWRADETKLGVLRCRSPYSCKGGVGEGDELCNIGYSGTLCGTCDARKEYASLEDSRSLETSLRCTKCWPKWLSGMSLFVLTIVQIVSMLLICRAARSALPAQIVYTKVIVSHFHMLATLGTINLGWPDVVGVLFPLARLTSTTSIKAFATDCVSKWNHIQYTTYSFGTVGIFAALCVPLYLYLRLTAFFKLRSEWYEKRHALESAYINARREGEDVEGLRFQLDRMKRAPDLNDSEPDAYKLQLLTKVNKEGYIVQQWTEDELEVLAPSAGDITNGLFKAVTLAMCWYPIFTNIMQMIRSTSVEGIGRFLFIDYNVRTDNARYKMTMYGYFILASIFVFGFPYFILGALKRHRNQLRWAKTKALYGFLYIGFTQERYYWEFVVMMRKGLLVAASVLLPETPLLAAYISIGILQSYLALVLILDIYEKDQHRKVEIASLTTILVSYNAGALMSTVKHQAASVIAALLIYALNLNFCITVLRSVRGDVKDEVIAAKIEAERKEIEDEHAYRREAVKRAIVDTHAASRALHPRMAEKLIAAFDDQVLVEELSKAGANDLKLRHLQLSVHLESLRNKWQASKSSMVDQSAHRDHEIEALALERKLKAIDHERWRRKNTAIGGSSEDEFEVASHSSEGERKSVASDDSAYAATGEKAARDSVEARVAQYNEIIAQQLRLARQSERTEKDSINAAKESIEKPAPLYPPGYIPRPPRLPARDSVSWTPPSADIMLESPTKPPRKPSTSSITATSNAASTSVDPFTYDYFEMTKMRDELSATEKVAELEAVMQEEINATAHVDVTHDPESSSGRRMTWREKMDDSRWRVQRRIEKRESRAMMRSFGFGEDAPNTTKLAGGDSDSHGDVDESKESLELSDSDARANDVVEPPRRNNRAATEPSTETAPTDRRAAARARAAQRASRML
jgi:hypothetical protein